MLFSACYLVIGETYFMPADNFPTGVYTICLLSLMCATAVFASISLSGWAARSSIIIKMLNVTCGFAIVVRWPIRHRLCFSFMNCKDLEVFLSFLNLESSRHGTEMRETRGNYPFSAILYCGFIVSIVTEFVAKTKSFSYLSVLYFYSIYRAWCSTL